MQLLYVLQNDVFWCFFFNKCQGLGENWNWLLFLFWLSSMLVAFLMCWLCCICSWLNCSTIWGRDHASLVHPANTTILDRQQALLPLCHLIIMDIRCEWSVSFYVYCLILYVLCEWWDHIFLVRMEVWFKLFFINNNRVRKSVPIMWKLDSANLVQLVNSTIPSLQVSRLLHHHRFPQFHICLCLYLHQYIQLYSPNLALRNNNMVYLLQDHLCYPAQ